MPGVNRSFSIQAFNVPTSKIRIKFCPSRGSKHNCLGNMNNLLKTRRSLVNTKNLLTRTHIPLKTVSSSPVVAAHFPHASAHLANVPAFSGCVPDQDTSQTFVRIPALLFFPRVEKSFLVPSLYPYREINVRQKRGEDAALPRGVTAQGGAASLLGPCSQSLGKATLVLLTTDRWFPLDQGPSSVFRNCRDLQ